MAKKNYMTIKNPADMVHLINHNIEVFEDAILKLAKKNRNACILGTAAIICAVTTAVKCRKQDEELYRLSIRVQKLENKEGE